MKQKGLEQLLVIVLFILALVLYTFAERDSRKQDRLYKTAQTVQQNAPSATTLLPASPDNKATN